MDMNKELEDFGIRFAGAMLGMEESALTEIYYNRNGKPTSFPYGQMSPNLAPNDNFLVAGLSIPPWVIGYLLEGDAEKKGDTKNKDNGDKLRKFGEGDVLYSFSLVLHDTLARNIPQTFPVQARAFGQQPTGPQQLERPRIAQQQIPGATPTSQDVRISDGARRAGTPEAIRISM
jgi:hypothetical protein